MKAPTSHSEEPIIREVDTSRLIACCSKNANAIVELSSDSAPELSVIQRLHLAKRSKACLVIIEQCLSSLRELVRSGEQSEKRTEVLEKLKHVLHRGVAD